MPDSAFQRNAFQRNAFQIYYVFEPTSTGGGVGGGSVTATFIPVTPPTPEHGGGGKPDRRIWHVIRNFFKRPKVYKPRATGGAVAGGVVEVEYFPLPEEFVDPEPVLFVYQPTASGGVVAGGSVQAVHRWYLPPPDNTTQFSFDDEPEPALYSPSSTGGGRGFGGTVVAVLKRAPDLVDFKAARLRRQIEEEDELLLMGYFDD